MTPRERRDWPYVIGFGLLLIVAILVWSISASWGHDWYDKQCCSGHDCKPVPDGDVVETSAGVQVKGWGTIPETDRRLHWSQDERDHVCVFQSSAMGVRAA